MKRNYFSIANEHTLIRPCRSRAGVSLVELIATATLISVAAAVIAQGTILALRQKRTVELRAAALQETANLVEQVQALPFRDVVAERLAERLRPSAEFLKLEPTAQVLVTLHDEEESLAGKQVRVAVRRTNLVNENETLAELVTWRWREGAK